MIDLICEMPERERPRERLFERGPDTLSDAELVALLLGSGTKGVGAVHLARQLLRDGLDSLPRLDLAKLARIRGLGPAKISRLAASIELSRRIAAKKPEVRPKFDLTEFGTMLVQTHSHHTQERLGAVLLDARHHILRQRELFVGTINYAVVSTREILRTALEDNAVAVVLYHNHPSGNPAPSPEDIQFTKKIANALGLADIELIDHIVIGLHSFVSMKGMNVY